jgi:hypothetical protein
MPRGLTRETRVMQFLAGYGWVCGSRRHIPGPGDVLAVRPLPATIQHEVRLIEVKSTLTPYSHFGPASRKEMSVLAREIGALAQLAWWPSRGVLVFIGEPEWPQ